MDWPQWTAHFQTTGYRIERIADPGVGSLSRFELGKIQELVDRYREKGEWEIVEETHAFPEWVKNNPGDSSKRSRWGTSLRLWDARKTRRLSSVRRKA